MFGHCCNHTATFLAILPVFLMACHGRKPPVSLAHCIHHLDCRVLVEMASERNKPGMNGNWAERGSSGLLTESGCHAHAPGRGKQEESVPAGGGEAGLRAVQDRDQRVCPCSCCRGSRQGCIQEERGSGNAGNESKQRNKTDCDGSSAETKTKRRIICCAKLDYGR